MSELDEQTAVITGASSGIGAATARLLGERGASVVLAARRQARLEDLADEIGEAYGVSALPVPTDLRDESAVTDLIDTAVSEHDGLDLLVNNAGVGTGGDVADLDTVDYRTMMEVNADGSFFATRQALPHLLEREGTLIFVGSVAGKYPRSYNPVYAATKWWVRGFAKSVAAQYGDQGLGVSVVNPSEVRTEFETADGSTFEQAFEPGAVTEPEEVAAAIGFAASARGSIPAEIDVFRRDKLADLF